MVADDAQRLRWGIRRGAMLRAALKFSARALVLVFLTACSLLFSTAAHAESAAVRADGAVAIGLSPNLEILEDPKGEATLADVMGPLAAGFKPNGAERPVFGVSPGAAWTRVRIDLSRDPHRASRRAQFDALHPDTVSFFIVGDDGRLLRTYHGGLDIPGSNTYRKFSVAVGDLGVESFILYSRLTTHYISTLGQILITAEEETRAEIAVERMVGPLFGAMLFALLLCLLLWTHLREPLYGYGFAVVLSIFITAQAHINLDRLFWPTFLQDGDITRMIYLGGSGFVHAFGVMFTSHFLGTNTRRPRLHAVARISALLIAAAMPLAVVATPYNFPLMLMLYMALTMVLIVLMVAEALRHNRRAAIMYILVAVPFLTCLLITNVASYNLITQHPISVSLAVIGITFLVAGITLALADGFRENLEAKVRERTAELSVANAALHEAHEEKNRMLGVVAHDLRNPLSGIRAASQLLIEIPLDQAKRETLLRTIRDGADVTLGMTEDLLDVAAIREGKVELAPAATDLAALVESRAELFRMSAQTKDIVLRLDLARIPPVWADAKRAAQALDNLVSNAVKYSPRAGEVTIELRAIDGRARLSVIDQGQGIPAHEVAGIFEPFKRASTQPTGGERSSGLGLAIVKRLMEAQNGEIRVQSTPGKGSRFDLLLPFATIVAGSRDGRNTVATAFPDALTPA